MEHQNTNKLAPELAASLACPSFSVEKKAGMSECARQTIEKQESFLL
jgi:hypothetical protein